MTWLLLGAILMLPWMTFWPLFEHQPNIPSVIAKTDLLIVLLLLAAAWIASEDSWLGLCVVIVILRGLWHPWTHAGSFRLAIPSAWSIWPDGSLETSLWAVGGGALILAARRLPEEATRHAVEWLVVLQLIAVSYQTLMGFPYRTGTLGQENALGIILGMTAPIVRSALLGPLLGGIWLTGCATALLASTGGVARKYGTSWFALVMSAGAILVALDALKVASLVIRQRVWGLALTDQTWWTVLIGHGWGSWAYDFSINMPQRGVEEFFIYALNEPLQLFYEGGILILVAVAGWIAYYRDSWNGPWGGAALAVGISGLAWSWAHEPIPALVGCVILGMATRK